MSLNLTQSTQFKIRTLSLITKVGVIDIAGIYQEINIYDSMFMPCVRGEILILDAIGLSSKLSLDGSEYLSMEISKDDELNSNSTVIKKTFRIYRQSERENLNQNSEAYLLYFASEEMIFSEQLNINQAFNGTHTEIVNVILKKYLKVSNKKLGIIENSKGLHSVVIPSLTPFEAVNWVSKRAINSESLPSFLFFENKYGYNFVSLSTLMKNAPIMDESKIVNCVDVIENIKNGVFSGKFIGIDPLTRRVSINKLDFKQTYGLSKTHLNKYPNFTGAINRDGKDSAQMFDSKISLYAFSSFRGSTPWVSQDPKTATIIDDTHKYVFQRAPILANLLQTTIHLNIPGNFAVTSGAIVNLSMPLRATKPDVGEELDETLSGKYIVTATRHIIKGDMHQTVIEVATDSTNRPFSTNQTNINGFV